jgi:Spy/CpxP family protein refolding chaperone
LPPPDTVNESVGHQVGYRKDRKMIRINGRLIAACAALAIAAMLAQAAMAQREEGRRERGGRGMGGPGFPPSMAMLATMDKVQDALKLSDDQKDKIKKINDDMRAEFRKMYESGARDRDKMMKLRDETQAKLNEVLDDGQEKRLMGIFVQVVGTGAVMNPAIGKEVGITDEQRKKLDAVGPPRDGRRPDGPPPEGKEGREGRRDGGSFREMRERMEKEIMAVLTDEQKQKLESLKGEKVEIDMSELRGFGGRRGEGRERGERPERGKREESEKKAAA